MQNWILFISQTLNYFNSQTLLMNVVPMTKER